TIDLYLHKNKNYLVMAAADRYFAPAVAVNPDTTLQPHLHGFTFQTLVAMEEPVELATVQFVENSDTLLPLAMVQLDALAQFLLANPNGGVEFLVNAKGQDDAMCYTLSQQRAAALRRHLQNRGIAPERVHLSPYGNANTKINRATPEVSIRFRER
ncbi:MAG: OmpA family protein, partial [Bacteroidales bacterium]|nr:OmpA family protein [Bacteroidales bacterium]